jgi:chromate reductase, NAD(P)H dehydrogenase (quinone)
VARIWGEIVASLAYQGSLTPLGSCQGVSYVVRTMRILGICGSLQQRSANRDLLHQATLMLAPTAELFVYDGLATLPYFNPDLERDAPLPDVETWRTAIRASDALLIASPEYGYSLPGVLKNAIDWVIGSGELERKVVAITAATAAPNRGERGLAALRQPLTAVSARIVGGEPIARGPAFEPSLRELLALLLAEARVPDRPPEAQAPAWEASPSSQSPYFTEQP